MSSYDIDGIEYFPKSGFSDTHQIRRTSCLCREIGASLQMAGMIFYEMNDHLSQFESDVTTSHGKP
jgi:hypothetical protein